MARGPHSKSNDLARHYVTAIRYPEFPADPTEQRELIRIFYDRVNQNKKQVPIEDARPDVIFRMASNLHERARAEYNQLKNNLPGTSDKTSDNFNPEKYILQKLERGYSSRSLEDEASILLEQCPDIIRRDILRAADILFP
ncbi:hypothetical protein KY308_01730, partial [Candidatus Woesearchaeota archaeon]|nr:hypothetical protein [Candidatus Woesearchaeota archaeon]